jgi:XTP/dITP diphosphohydrolase
MELPRILVIATRNQGKTAEIRDFLNDFSVEVRNLDDFGPIPEVVEDGETFEENAYKKAVQTARMLGFPALADDSGLAVNALDGAPGVYSARYAGEKATDAENNAKLLAALEGVSDRRAAFHCVISIAVPTGPALTYEATCEGEIVTTPAGEEGFGYDPLFFYPPLGKTFAELTRAEKGAVSHRGQALREVRDEFDKVLKWIRMQMPVWERVGCAGNSQ